jgi:lysophospholipase L1-like esterase
LTIFAKGNLDVRDSLYALKSGGRVLWNGINEIVRARFPGTLVRVRHETWTRSDALLGSDGTIPGDLSARRLPLEPYSATAQFSHALLETDADVIVLSLQPDVTTTLVRHRGNGYLFHPSNSETWPEEDRRWLRDTFGHVDLLEVEASMRNLATIVARIRQRTAAPILVYNLSSVVPGERVHSHEGLGDIFSSRIRRFNLGLIELSQQTGISIIDVDAIIARGGADRLKLDAIHLTAEGCRLVAEEVARVLEDFGCFAPAEVSGCA